MPFKPTLSVQKIERKALAFRINFKLIITYRCIHKLLPVVHCCIHKLLPVVYYSIYFISIVSNVKVKRYSVFLKMSEFFLEVTNYFQVYIQLNFKVTWVPQVNWYWFSSIIIVPCHVLFLNSKIHYLLGRGSGFLFGRGWQIKPYDEHVFFFLIVWVTRLTYYHW